MKSGAYKWSLQFSAEHATTQSQTHYLNTEYVLKITVVIFSVYDLVYLGSFSISAENN